MGRTVLTGVAAGAVVFVGVAAQDVPVRFVPAELQDTAWLQRLGDAQGRGRRRRVPRFPVHRSPGRERHHVQAPNRRRRRQDVQGGALRSRQRHRDRRRRWRRPVRHLLREPGRRQPALEEPRGRKDSRTSPPPPAWPCRTRSACPRRLPTSTTTATPTCTSRRCAAATCSFENDGRGRFRDITAASGLDYAGHSSGAVFFDYNRDGRLDLFLVNVGRYTTNTIGGDGYKYYVGVRGRLLGPSQAGARRAQASCIATRAATASSTCRSRRASWTSPGRATRARSTSTTTGGRTCTC